MSTDHTHAARQARYRAKQQARYVELEKEVTRLRAELASRDSKPIAPITINADTLTPALKGRPAGCRETPAGKERRRKGELRDAVKEAEKKVEREWRRSGIPGTVDHPQRLLHDALSTARAAAREDIRARWAREDAEAAAAKVELPTHITRLPPGAVDGPG